MRFSYPLLRRLGLGALLAVVIGLAAIPTALLVIEFIQAEQRDAIEDAQDWAEDAAEQVADHHRSAIATTHALLIASALRLEPQVAPPTCTLKAGERRTVWLVSDTGSCSEGPDSLLPRESVTKLIEQTAKTGFAIVGPYEVAGGNLHVFGVLTRRSADGVMWHIMKSVDLTWEPKFNDELVAPSDLVVMALDPAGHVFQRVGPGTVADEPLSPTSSLAEVTETTAIDVDGVKRIVGVAPVHESGVTMMVGLSHEAIVATARQKLFASLALFASVITLSGLIAWLIIERMVLRSVRLLRDAAVATANGAYDRYVSITDGPVELRDLADAFNEMTTKLQHQALHDQLTGLANRRLLAQRLEDYIAEKRAFSALAIDLDGFKPVNDTHGHTIGDFVLSAVAGRLKAAISEDTLIGRTGGDEFLALIPIDDSAEASDDVPDKRAVAAARAMLYQIGQPIILDQGGEVIIGGCIGIAFWPQDGATAEDIVRQADVALYRAKKSGKNRYSIFNTPKGDEATQAA